MTVESAQPPAHVLAIDDEEANLTLLRAVLSAYQVTCFDRPEHALEALTAGSVRPDLIVCDVTMPGMTGFELHHAVRALPAVRSVPFVYLTAHDTAADRRRGMGLGADDYLTKPYAPNELRQAVQARLARVDALRTASRLDLHIVSLGGLDVHLGGQRVQWEAKRAAELLLLLLDVGGDASFEGLRGELWWRPPDANQLHVLMSRLRKALGDRGRVDAAGEAVHLVLPGRVTWDAEDFVRQGRAALEAAASASERDAGRDAGAAVERALERYRGPFLPEAEGPWVERRRGEFEELYLELLDAAVEGASGDAARERARERLERFLDLEGA